MTVFGAGENMKKKMFGIVGALALALTGCVQVQVGVGTDNGFVSLAEAVPDAILEIRYYSTYNFVGEHRRAQGVHRRLRHGRRREGL